MPTAARRVRERRSRKSQRKQSEPRAAKRRSQEGSNRELPTERNIPNNDLFKSLIMIYGKKKIGKTSLTNEFSENMLHEMLEPMARELPIYQTAVNEYEDFKSDVNLLIAGDHDYDAVSIDPLPLLYKRTMEYRCAIEGINHPSDRNDFGATWDLVNSDFNDVIRPLLNSPFGVFFNCHETEDDVKTRDGKDYKVIRPEGGAEVWRFINANIENIWYYHLRGKERFLQIRGDDYAFACTAWTDRFYTPSGDQIYCIPMGSNPKEGFDNIQLAFENKQERTYSEKEYKQERSERRKNRNRNRNK